MRPKLCCSSRPGKHCLIKAMRAARSLTCLRVMIPATGVLCGDQLSARHCADGAGDETRDPKSNSVDARNSQALLQQPTWQELPDQIHAGCKISFLPAGHGPSSRGVVCGDQFFTRHCADGAGDETKVPTSNAVGARSYSVPQGRRPFAGCFSGIFKHVGPFCRRPFAGCFSGIFKHVGPFCRSGPVSTF